MPSKWCFFIIVLPLCAQVRYIPDQHEIDIDGKPFTTLHTGEDANKPYLWPLRTADGKLITRRWPNEKDTGESHDHMHHRGLWFAYDEVNGVHFWGNDPSYATKDPKIGKIVVTKTSWSGGGKKGTLTMDADWNGPDGKTLLREHRLMTFYDDPKDRIIDFDITLTAAEPVTLGDSKEGAFAIRLADSLSEKKTGHMVNAEGKQGMKNVWGKRSNWVDYSGEVDGEKVGVAIFDAGSNPRHPVYWHSRDYGLFALDPFGAHAFDPSQPESEWKLDPGKSLRFRWRVVIHPGDAQDAHIRDLYQKWSESK
jgi:hypothetical protein